MSIIQGKKRLEDHGNGPVSHAVNQRTGDSTKTVQGLRRRCGIVVECGKKRVGVIALRIGPKIAARQVSTKRFRERRQLQFVSCHTLQHSRT
jgi:hypothetical protein